MSRVNRGGPLASSGSSGLLQGNAAGGGGGGARTGRGGYAGAAGSSAAPSSQRGAAGSSGSEWASPSAGRPPATSALKPSGAGANNNPTSPNPYAPAFNPAGPASPWSTPSGGGANSRYKPARSGSASGSSSGTAARTLFPSGSGSGDFTKKGANWEEGASEGTDEPSGGASSGGGGGGGGSGGSLLRGGSGAHPEHWESYDAGQSSHASAAGGAPTHTANGSESTSLSLTPFDSPSLGPYRASPTELAAEALQLDAKGTDVSLSVLKSKDGGANEISIHMLSLLYDPPVQGCELKPYVSVVDSHGRVSAVQTDEAAQGLDFRWFRGQKRLCSNTTGNCSKAALIQCVSCAKLGASDKAQGGAGGGIPQHLTYFCSDKCLRENWPQHKQMHQQQALQLKQNQAMEKHEWNCDEDVESSRPDSPSALHCKFPSLLQNSWQETGSDRAYVPTLDDIGRAMRLECSPILKQEKALGAGSRSGSTAADRKASASAASAADKDVVTSTSSLNTDLNLGAVVRIDTGAVIPTPLPPPPRTILYTDPSTPINSSNTFRTVCYNVLAQIYATRQVYPYTSIWALSWEYRKLLLLRDILSHHADIICLQEVQSNHFESFFQPQLSKQGYDGIFKKKTRDAGNDSSGNQMIDGCATFYKRERFALMEQYGIEFNEAARQHTANRTQLRRLLKGNIALVLVLEELSPPPSSSAAAAARRNRKRRLCITNTHIFWDPEYPDVKLWQTWVLCQELEKLVLPRNLPLVLCGDFNSLVESSVYELLSTERVEQGEDVFGATGDPTGLLPAPHQVSHRLPLLSAYATIGEPKYTNYTGSFIGVLDYVFFTRTHLRCVACMDVDDESLLRQHTALPSPHYPSDHIALVTTLEFMDA